MHIDWLCMVRQVLHMDRNDYYGGESTSLNLIQVLSEESLPHNLIEYYSYIHIIFLALNMFDIIALEAIQRQRQAVRTSRLEQGVQCRYGP